LPGPFLNFHEDGVTPVEGVIFALAVLALVLLYWTVRPR
jgi:hypothetical protein